MTSIPGWSVLTWPNAVNPSPGEAITATLSHAPSDDRSDCCMMPGRETTMVGTGWLLSGYGPGSFAIRIICTRFGSRIRL
jgi:hypothetical protein